MPAIMNYYDDYEEEVYEREEIFHSEDEDDTRTNEEQVVERKRKLEPSSNEIDSMSSPQSKIQKKEPSNFANALVQVLLHPLKDSSSSGSENRFFTNINRPCNSRSERER